MFQHFKIALAWNAELKAQNGRYESVLSTDLDLVVKHPLMRKTIATSSSFHNSYEVAEFNATRGRRMRFGFGGGVGLLRRRFGVGLLGVGILGGLFL